MEGDSTAPQPAKRRPKGGNLPNMFRQQENRQQEYQKKRESGVGVTVMNKKVFTGFLDKFEDERGRLEAKARMQQMVLAQKESAKLKQEEERKKTLQQQENEENTRRLEKEEVKFKEVQREERPRTGNDDANNIKMQKKFQESISNANKQLQPKPVEKGGAAAAEPNKIESHQYNTKQVGGLVEVVKSEHPKKNTVTPQSINMSEARKSQARKSKEEMQNYLLSHILFEDPIDEEPKKKKNSIDDLFEQLVAQEVDPAELERYMEDCLEQERPKPTVAAANKKQYRQDHQQVVKPVTELARADSIDDLFENLDAVVVDPDCVKELESYYAVLHKDKAPQPEKRKKANLPKLQVVEINNIRNRFENNLTPGTATPRSSGSSSSNGSPLEGRMNKYEGSLVMVNGDKPKPVRQGKLLGTDLLNKFDSPQLAEQTKKQREKEREEQRLLRLAKLEEEKKRQEALEMLERQRLQEEERLKMAYEAMLKEEKEKAEARRKRDQELKERREQNEPQLKKKKVLDRFQHMFDKKPEGPQQNQKPVGQLKADDLFSERNEDEEKRVFQDPSLTGVSQMVNKMRNKLDGKETSKPVPATARSGIEKKKKTAHPAVLMFHAKAQQQASIEKAQQLPPPNAEKTQWAWKAKKAADEQQASNTNRGIVKEIASSMSKQQSDGQKELSSKGSDRPKTKDEKATDQAGGDNSIRIKIKIKKDVTSKPKKKVTAQSNNALEKKLETSSKDAKPVTSNAVKKMQQQLLLEQEEKDKTARVVSPGKCKAAPAIDSKSTTDHVGQKQNCINELQQLLSNNSHLLPHNVKTIVQHPPKAAQQQDLIASLGEYLKAPDKSLKERDFKSEVERQLRVIKAGAAQLPRKEPVKVGPSKQLVIKDEKPVNDNKSKDQDTKLPKSNVVENICIPKIASAPKRKFHDKCVQLQMCLNALSATGGTDGPVKSLEEVKAETESKRWKWKELQARDMQDYMEAHNGPMPSNIAEKQKRLREFGQELKEKETAATTTRDVEEIRRIRERKDREFEAFIRDVKDYVDQSESNQSEFKAGVQGYLDLIEDGPSEKPSLYDKSSATAISRPENYNFNATRKMLQKTFEGEFGPVEEVKRNWTVRKVVEEEGNADEGLSLRPAGSRNQVAAAKKTDAAKKKLEDDKSLRLLKKEDFSLTEPQGMERRGRSQRPQSAIFASANQSDTNMENLYQLYLSKLHGNSQESTSPLKNIMGMIRHGQVGPVESNDWSSSNSTEDVKDIKAGLCANLRSVFEKGHVEEDERRPTAKPAFPRSRSCVNVRNAFERDSPSPLLSRANFQISDEERSVESSASLRRKFEMTREEERPTTASAAIPLGKSPSFSKFREAFESGNADELLVEESAMQQKKPTKITGVKAELEALKQSPRLQNLLRINKPKQSPNPLSRSRTTSSVDLDDKALASVSKSKAAIKDMFENSAPKMTFGGGLKKSSTAPSQPVIKQGAAPKKKAAAQFTERKWVFDTINKYFDVIKEDQEEEEDEEVSDVEQQSSIYSSQASFSNTASNRSSVAFSPSPSTSRCLSKKFQEDQSIKKSSSMASEAGNKAGNTSKSPPKTAPPPLVRSQSSSKLRDMVASIAKSRSNVGIDKFKENLSSHLKLRSSTESLNSGVASPYLSKRMSANFDPGVNDSDVEDSDDEFEEVTFDTPRYTRVKL